MEVISRLGRDYHIKLHIRNRADNFTWILVAIYGAAQVEFKADFLHELVNLAKDNPYPILVGGDFNLLRFRHEKSKGQFDDHWSFLFNVVIDSLDLREVSMTGRQFTWANSLPDPTYEKLDRVLMDANWESKFPMVSVRALQRIEGFSDHAPILLTTGTPKPLGNHRFKSEHGWLQWDGFHDMVKTVCDRPIIAGSPIQRWNYKICALRSHLSGWARHVNAAPKKEKLRRSSITDDLEDLVEVGPLSMHEFELKNQSNEKIASLLMRRNSNDTNVQRAVLFLKEIQMLITSIVWPMADIGRNTFIILFRMKIRLRDLTTSRLISLITTEVCLEHRKKVPSLWMSLKQMIFPKFLM
jgi:hypothetical protein